MTAELFKKTEETTMKEGVEVKELIQLETIVKDEHGNEVARVSSHHHNGSFQIYNGQKVDVQMINDAIVEVILLSNNIIE